jgi:hypothetical protein
MRTAGVGLIVGLLIGVALAGAGFPQAQAQRPVGIERGQTGDSLIALSCDTGDGRQQVTVVDPHSRALAVYHIDRASGAVQLRSVRNVQWDLQMEDFNSASPTPREIRNLAEQR